MGQKFQRDLAMQLTLPQDSSSWHVHIEIALLAIEDSIAKQELLQPPEQTVGGLQLHTPELKMALMSQLYPRKDGVQWENWERDLPQGFASSLHTVLTSSALLEVRRKGELGDCSPECWCLLPGEMESWWFDDDQRLLILMQGQVVRGGKSGTSFQFDVYKVPGNTIKTPLIRKTFEAAQKEKLPCNSQIGSMILESGLFHEAWS